MAHWVDSRWLLLLKFKSVGLSLDCCLIRWISHGGIIFNFSNPASFLAVLVSCWCGRVLHITVSRGVLNDEFEWESLSIGIFSQSHAILVNFLSCFWVNLSSLFLHSLKSLNGGSKVSLNGLDGPFLSCRGHLEAALWDSNSCKF
jgi:hypothetical protein